MASPRPDGLPGGGLLFCGASGGVCTCISRLRSAAIGRRYRQEPGRLPGISPGESGAKHYSLRMPFARVDLRGELYWPVVCLWRSSDPISSQVDYKAAVFEFYDLASAWSDKPKELQHAVEQWQASGYPNDDPFDVVHGIIDKLDSMTTFLRVFVTDTFPVDG